MDENGFGYGGFMPGDAAGLCGCGCGSELLVNKYGYKPRVVFGHRTVRRSEETWRKLYEDFVSSLPECGCGCGGIVLPCCKTLDNFIKEHGSRAHPRFLKEHDKHPPGWNIGLSVGELRSILGTLLGDGSIILPNPRSKNYRLAWTHGPAQMAWVEHKAAALIRLGPVIRTAENRGYGKISIRMHTHCLPSITDIAKIVLVNGKKTVTISWLDQLGSEGLAWWYCDDGSLMARRYPVLHTQGYSES